MKSKHFGINFNQIFIIVALLSILFLSSNLIIRYILVGMSILLFILCLLLGQIKMDFKFTKPVLLVILIILWFSIGLVYYGYWRSGYMRYLLFIYQTIISFFLAFQIKDIEKTLYTYFVTLLLLNLFFLIFMREYSVYMYLGDYVFRGLYYDKNIFAFNTVLGVPVFLNKIIRERNKKSIFSVIWIILSIYLVYISKSTSALIFIFVLSILTLLSKEICLKLIPKIYLAFIAFALYLIYYDSIISSTFNRVFTDIFGKNLSFSGRSTIWYFSLRLISKNPISGYGYNGFWSDIDRVNHVSLSEGFRFGGQHAHNGYIEILVSGGVIAGILIFILLCFIYKQLKKKEVIEKITNIEFIFLLFILYGNFIYNNIISLGFSWSFIIILLVRLQRIEKSNMQPAISQNEV